MRFDIGLQRFNRCQISLGRRTSQQYFILDENKYKDYKDIGSQNQHVFAFLSRILIFTGENMNYMKQFALTLKT